MHMPLESHVKCADGSPILSEDEKLLQTLEGREDYYRRQLGLLYILRTQSEKKKRQDEELKRLRLQTNKNAADSATAKINDTNDFRMLTEDDELIQLARAFDDYYRFQLGILYRMKSQVEARIRLATTTVHAPDKKKQWELLKIGQIRSLFLKHMASQECASLLIADIASVEFIYAKLQDCPDMDAPTLCGRLDSYRSSHRRGPAMAYR